MQTIIPTKRAMKSIISGIANSFVPRMKKIKKPPLRDVILNLMLVTQQLIYLMKKMVPIFVYFSQGVAVPMELIADITIEFQVLRTAR